MKKLLLSCLALLSGSWLMAQRADTARLDTSKFVRYRVYGLGLEFPVMRDQFQSPLRYSGGGLVLNILTMRVKPPVFKQFSLRSGISLLDNNPNTNTLIFWHAEADYGYYRLLKDYQSKRLRLYAGGGADLFIHTKYLSLNVNNTFTYEAALSLKALGMVQYDFSLFRRNFRLTEQVGIPFMAILARPPFAWAAPYAAYETGGTWTKAFQVVSFGNYLRLQNRLALDFFPSEKKRRKARYNIASNWRFIYEWEYLQIRRPNEVKEVIPTFLLGRVIRF
jgi:hypothetical protein